MKKVSKGIAITNQIREIGGGFIDPESVVAEWGIKEGENIADLGCGGGYFTIPMAKIVGQEGKVFAVDVIEGSLEALKSRAYLERLNNVTVIRADIERKNSLSKWVKAGECQKVILANLLYTSSKKKAIINEAKRILSFKGKLIVIEWDKKIKSRIRNFGPSFDSRLSKKELINLITQKELMFENEFEAGEFHFGMIFKKS